MELKKLATSFIQPKLNREAVECAETSSIDPVDKGVEVVEGSLKLGKKEMATIPFVGQFPTRKMSGTLAGQPINFSVQYNALDADKEDYFMLMSTDDGNVKLTTTNWPKTDQEDTVLAGIWGEDSVKFVLTGKQTTPEFPDGTVRVLAGKVEGKLIGFDIFQDKEDDILS